MAFGLFLGLCWALLLLSALCNADQQILTLDSKDIGVLRRFSVRDSTRIKQLLQLAMNHDLDVWQVTPSAVDIYSPSSALPLPDVLRGFPHSITNISVPNYHLNRTFVSNTDDWNLTSLANSTYHSAYHPLYEIDAFIYKLADLYPNITHVDYLGHSGEGREMLSLTISRTAVTTEVGGKMCKKKGAKIARKKLGFVITGAQHAREWIATATSLYLAHALVANASEPHSLSHLLDHFDFYIIPSPNPDGYDYTWESDRFWYKNRQVLGPRARCIGLDLNRNWGYKWKPKPVVMSKQLPAGYKQDKYAHRPKSPVDPCSDWYPGHRPFESPEVNNIANYITTLPKLEAFIDLRSYGQMLSSPYSYSCKRVPKDAENQIEAALGAAQALKMMHGTQFMTGSLCSMLYRAPGNIVDWMYARAHITYSYAAHLRDTGTYGFALPPEWIRPVGEETGNLVDYLAKFIMKQPKL